MIFQGHGGGAEYDRMSHDGVNEAGKERLSMSSTDGKIFTPETGVPVSTGLSDLEANNPAPAGGFSPKRLYESDDVAVTHVAFDSGIELPEHTAPFPIVVQVPYGSVDFHVGETVHRLSQGAVLFLAAEIPHSVDSLEPSHVIVTFIK